MRALVLLALAAASLLSCEDTEFPGESPVEPGALPDGSGSSFSGLSCPGFELQGDQVKVLATGLVWDCFVELSFRTHDEASALCAERGARLPTRAELQALQSPTQVDGCQLPACPFLGDRCATIQCGSVVPGTEAHWGVAFSGGGLVMVPPDGAEALLCVR